MSALRREWWRAWAILSSVGSKRRAAQAQLNDQRGASSVIKSFTALAISTKPAALNSLIDTNTPTLRVGGKRDIAELALQPAALLQDQRAIALGLHDNPSESHLIHMARFP